MKEKSYSIKENNAGLSLVELIVVLAIMSVMLGAAVLNTGLLASAEAKGCAQKVIAVLNDVKTGNFTRAGEELVIRYISVESDKTTWAKKGVGDSGYYADKSIYTIMNADNIKQALSDDHEFTKLGPKSVKITFVTSAGDYVLPIGGAVRISFDRKTGELKSIETGTVGGDDSFSGSVYGELNEIKFESGSKTVTIKVDSKRGTYSL